MAVKQLWLNLPVKDIKVSKQFYTAIGFRPNPMHENSENLGSFFVSEQNIVLMLFPESQFEHFTANRTADTSMGTEVLINIDAESIEEVDVFAEKVRSAGGKIYAEPSLAQGWMYAFGFCDPDGHRWSQLYMDFSKMPKHQ